MNNIESLIPHRSPFLFVDKLISADKEKIVGEFTFKPDEFFFKGHFPSYPVVPGVILIESMAQCGGAGVRELGLLPGDALFFLAMVEKAKFRNQVKPGDKVRYEITNIRTGGPMLKQSGIVYLEGDVIACEASWTCIVGKA